jgi:hypothetical protein
VPPRAPGRAILGAFAALAALAIATPVAAHGEYILQLGADRIQPGGAIEVRGDLGTGEAFEVALVSKLDGSRRVIATIPAVEEGHFQTYVTVPADVPTGDYLLEVAVDLTVIRAPLAIAGTPITGSGEEGSGPDHDPLVGPMPTGAGAGVVAGSSAAPNAPAASDLRGTRSPLDGASILAGALAAAVVLLAALRLGARRRASGRAGAGPRVAR